MLFETLSLPEAIFVVAIFGIPMVAAIVIFTMISRRRARRLGQNSASGNPGVTRSTPNTLGMLTEEEFARLHYEYGNLIFAICCFVLAPLYSSFVADYVAAKTNNVNAVFEVLYLFCGKDIPVVGFIVAGLFFLAKWVVRFIRLRQSSK